MNRATFPADLEEGLNAHFGMEHNTYPEEWRACFEVEDSDKAWETDVLEVGFGAAPEKDEGGIFEEDEGAEGWKSTYYHKTIAMGFSVTQEAIEDNLYKRLVPRYSRALARAFKHTKDIRGAAIFNNATTTTGGDGVSLLSTAHPLYGGGTTSNKLATPADISEAAIEQLVIQARKAVDDRNVPIALKVVRAIIPPELVFITERILKSSNRVATADNDTNALRSKGLLQTAPAEITRLTDADRWFLKTDCPDGLKYMDRIAMQTDMREDFSTGNMRYKGRERYSFGWSDWRSVYGSEGAG